MIKTLIGLSSITLGLLALAVAARFVVEIWERISKENWKSILMEEKKDV
ncbi:hypothetical protein [Thomasclavelia cocleata]|nr:hypothetical protein [Thomasclavelia cocleata]